MQKSESIAALAASLAKAQAEMSAAPFDRDNPFFKSRYATLASVMAAAKPIHGHGLAIIQTAEVRRSEAGTIVTVNTMLTHASGEWVQDSLDLKPTKDDPQSIGSAITYGRRYSAAAIVGLATEEDDDGNEASGKPAAKPAPKPAPKKEEPKPESKKESAPFPAPPKTEAGSGGEMAAAIKATRDAAIAAGCLTREEVFATVSAVCARPVTDWTQCSAIELANSAKRFLALKAEADKLAAEAAANGDQL